MAISLLSKRFLGLSILKSLLGDPLIYTVQAPPLKIVKKFKCTKARDIYEGEKVAGKCFCGVQIPAL